MSLRAHLAETLELDRGGRSNNRAMEGLRGLAIVMVFLIHFGGLVDPWVREGSVGQRIVDYCSLGGLGVDLFFVLSGYLIWGMLIRAAPSFRTYASRRLWRIYPTFLVAFGLAFVGAAVTRNPFPLPTNPIELLGLTIANLLLLPGVMPADAILEVAWSLSFEVAAYVLFFVVINWGKLRERTSDSRLWVLGSIAAAHVIATTPFSLPPRMLSIFAGAAMWEIVQRRRVVVGSNARFTAMVCVLGALLGAWWLDEGVGPIVVSLGFTVFVAVVLHDGGWLGSAMRWTPLRWFGNMSYSYYLVHALVLSAVKWVATELLAPTAETNQPWLLALWCVPAFALTVVVSYAMYAYVERPVSLTADRNAVAVRVLHRLRIVPPSTR